MQPYDIAWIATVDLDARVWLAGGHDAVVVAAASGPVVARDARDGRALWSASIPVDVRPVTGDGLVFVVSDGTLLALDERTGARRWQATLGTPDAAGWQPVPPTWRSGWLFAATATGITAFRAVDGTPIWHRDIGPMVTGPIAVDGPRLFAVLASRQLIALDVSSGALQWVTPLDAAARTPAAGGGRVFFDGGNRFFYCYTEDEGDLQWHWQARTDLVGPPAVGPDNVYFVGLDNLLEALSTRTGAVRWRQPLDTRPAGSPILIADSHLAVPLTSGDLLLFLAEDGRSAGRLPVPAAASESPDHDKMLEDAIWSADAREVLRATSRADGRRKIVAYREAMIPVSPFATAPGRPLDLRGPVGLLARR